MVINDLQYLTQASETPAIQGGGSLSLMQFNLLGMGRRGSFSINVVELLSSSDGYTSISGAKGIFMVGADTDPPALG